jgi:hypothetical protein
MATTYTHCLRPVFTGRIVQLLQNGRSINLIGAEGIGRGRLLEDIRACQLPNTRVVLINLKNYRQSYQGLIREICEQLGKPGAQPQALSDVIEQCGQQAEHIVMLFHHFDALLDKPDLDPRYDVAFFDTLNYYRNRPNIALLCVTEKPHNQFLVYVNGKEYRNSWLDLDQKFLPQLNSEEIIEECDRRVDPLQVRKDGTLTAMIEAVQAHHAAPYNFLLYLTDKIANHEDKSLPAQKKLKKWEHEFAQVQSRLNPAGIHRMQEQIALWRRVLGLEPGRVRSRWKLVLSIVIGVLGLLGAIGKLKPDIVKSLIEVLRSWIP